MSRNGSALRAIASPASSASGDLRLSIDCQRGVLWYTEFHASADLLTAQPAASPR